LEIQALLAGLGKDLRAFQEDFQLVGKHLNNALSKFDDARKKLDKYGYKLEQIESQPSLPLLDKKD
jgi:DNA anti-recombination protein RmuC